MKINIHKTLGRLIFPAIEAPNHKQLTVAASPVMKLKEEKLIIVQRDLLPDVLLFKTSGVFSNGTRVTFELLVQVFCSLCLSEFCKLSGLTMVNRTTDVFFSLILRGGLNAETCTYKRKL